jgi:hypothetical protein
VSDMWRIKTSTKYTDLHQLIVLVLSTSVI